MIVVLVVWTLQWKVIGEFPTVAACKVAAKQLEATVYRCVRKK